MQITTDDFPVHLGSVVRLVNTKTPEVVFARIKDKWENNERVFYLSGFLTEMDIIVTKLAKNPVYMILIDEATKLVEDILLKVFVANISRPTQP